ncbi:MAG: hypothetical protein ACE5DO_08825, partial [Desulfobacterales bacterium]
MTEKRAKRKLSAILSADVKGYSRLMRENELYTVRTLEAYRKVMMTAILKYRGRVVDSPGDNLLAEFASVVDAVESAVEIQKDLGVKNSELPTSRKMEFRKGNLQARKMFEKAIERDSKFALAYALNGRTHLMEWS